MHLCFFSFTDWNNYTGECVWEEPEGYKEVNYTLLMAMAKGPVKMQHFFSLLLFTAVASIFIPAYCFAIP